MNKPTKAASDKKATSPSDKGGVAARVGFKYQDHIAAQCVIRMISLPDLLQVECETSDDITLIWSSGGATYPEYIQVKTTEDDKKWSNTEVCKSTEKGKQNSLVEKSLLCDANATNPRFRIVSRRDVAKALSCLKIDIIKRSGNADIKALVESFKKKIKTKSPNNRDIEYWVKNTVWQVAANEDALTAINYKMLSNLAESHGANTSNSHIESIYGELLTMVAEAAEASKVTNPDMKAIARDEALTWWKKQLDESDAAVRKTSKPYRVKTDGFLTELHFVTDDLIKRALSSYDVRYERQVWRTEQLAEYLAGWLPEIALKASELVEVNHRTVREKLRAALLKISTNRLIDHSRLLAEILLHTVLRDHFSSEPIACKLYYQANDETKVFGNAHIMHGHKRDELWLGQGALVTADAYDKVLSSIIKSLDKVLDVDFLKEERNVIVTLREPQHLLPTTLENALKHNAPIDDLLDVLCVPILIAYDSVALSKGFSESYKENLIAEVSEHYLTIKSKLPSSVKDVKIHIFLIPIENVKTLLEVFITKIGGSV